MPASIDKHQIPSSKLQRSYKHQAPRLETQDSVEKSRIRSAERTTIPRFSVVRQSCSADLQSAVSQNCILRTVRNSLTLETSPTLPIINRRYSSLQICST